MIVMKFGGTSVKDASAMKQVLEIVRDSRKKIVVLSACSGITDKLIKTAENSVSNYSYSLELIEEIRNHHYKVIQDLEIAETDIYDTVNIIIEKIKLLSEGINLLNELTNKSFDAIVSNGEMLSTSIFNSFCNSQGVKSKFLNARECIRTNSEFSEAKVNFEITQNLLIDFLKSNNDTNIFITQGFIGSDEKKNPTTLGRGGSDYSAAIIGSLVDSEAIDIFTDVNGILTADPRIVTEPKTISNMTFEEVAELSFYGAKVLHPDTINPAFQNNIPVFVKNTFNPYGENTKIHSSYNNKLPVINSLTLKKNIIKLSLEFSDNKEVESRIENIIKYLSNLKIRIYYSQISSSGLIVIIDKSNDIIDHLKTNFKFIHSQSSIENEIIILVGNNLNNERIFRSIFSVSEVLKKSEISFVSAGLNKNSILIGTFGNRSEEILIELHNVLFR